jgi:microcystin-dependent protein
MGDPYMSELRLMSFNFPPNGWAFCNGQLLPIQQNQALFSLLGVTYGGNGVTTFALPNLQGRVPVHGGTVYPLGAPLGEESHILTGPEMPQHLHTMGASSVGATIANPSVLAASPGLYGPAASLTTLAPQTVSTAGAGQPHSNMPPYSTLNWSIALVGVYPSRS